MKELRLQYRYYANYHDPKFRKQYPTLASWLAANQ